MDLPRKWPGRVKVRQARRTVMDLPRKWPGRVKVRQALTLMRLLGKWYPRIDAYAKANKAYQKRNYWLFREAFYWEVHGLHPEHPRVKRIGR